MAGSGKKYKAAFATVDRMRAYEPRDALDTVKTDLPLANPAKGMI